MTKFEKDKAKVLLFHIGLVDTEAEKVTLIREAFADMMLRGAQMIKQRLEDEILWVLRRADPEAVVASLEEEEEEE